MRSPQKPAGLLLKQAEMVISRLERLTPDSSWAHRASGCRGTLLRLSHRVQTRGTSNQRPGPCETHELSALEQALNAGFFILEEAAQEHYR